MSAMQSLSAKYRLLTDLKINLLLCLYIFYKIVDKRLPSNLSEGNFLQLQLMDFNYVAVAAKIPNLKDLQHSESASDLQQCLYLIV